MKKYFHACTMFLVAVLFADVMFGQGRILEIDPEGYPTSEAVYEVGPDMPAGRLWHHAVVLANGDVALIGGITNNFVSLNTIEVFSSSENTFTTYTMNHTHASPAIARLHDGSYLIAGGSANLGVPKFAISEIFDPEEMTFTLVGNMVRFRANGGSAALNDGRVVVAGAWWSHNDAHTHGEIFDTETKSFTEIGPFGISRSHAVVIPTNDGQAMILGGLRHNGVRENLPVELYDPTNGEISTLQSSLLAGETLWTILNTETLTDNQKLADETYLWMASKAENNVVSFNLVIIDPMSKEIDIFETDRVLPDSRDFSFIGQPVIDNEKNRAYLLAVVSGADTYQIAAFTVDLETGAITKSSNYHVMDHYQMQSVPAVLLSDGRIFVSGGSVSNNFDAVNHTMFVTPPEPAAPTASTPVSELPANMALHQNYPNPFNPKTVIGYELTEAAEVLLEIYCITGQHLAVLHYGYQAPGMHNVVFDAGYLASGIYLYRLSTDNRVLTRKMTVVR